MTDFDDRRFWDHADHLVAISEVVIDRPAGSAHPRYPAVIYPFDYGYLSETAGGDGDGIDVWRGSQREATVTAAIVTIDLHKRDAEVKLLIGCTEDEIQAALATHQTDSQAAVLCRRSAERT